MGLQGLPGRPGLVEVETGLWKQDWPKKGGCPVRGRGRASSLGQSGLLSVCTEAQCVLSGGPGPQLRDCLPGQHEHFLPACCTLDTADLGAPLGVLSCALQILLQVQRYYCAPFSPKKSSLWTPVTTLLLPSGEGVLTSWLGIHLVPTYLVATHLVSPLGVGKSSLFTCLLIFLQCLE